MPTEIGKPSSIQQALVSARVAKSLGLKVRPNTHSGTFISVKGKFRPIRDTTISSLMLPTLSKDRTVSMELEVVQTQGT